ncbi:hypothetical protein KPL37_04950 [Clostridium frigoris]|uniref:Uncharacterized protein n=1 Tax=Clostridium frigoris TaxID=205327 RepID=A0ABS6BRJ2_9CLOT|nr:hypothetical protein [Clostridium frigoris]
MFDKESGTLLVAPSANLLSKPSTTSGEHCYNDLNGKIPCILDCSGFYIRRTIWTKNNSK